MGTQALTRVYDEYGHCLMCMHTQYDGYVEDGYGDELVAFLKDKVVLDGFLDETLETSFNGLGCLAAAVVVHFKKDIGNTYLMPMEGLAGYEYEYHVYVDEHGFINVDVIDNGNTRKLLPL